MDSFFKSQIWQIRIAIAVAMAVLVMILSRIALGSALGGPWLAAPICGALAAYGVHALGMAWPDKMPNDLESLQNGIDRWKQMRSKSTKTAGGKIVWGIGRSAIAMMFAWYFIGMVYGFADHVKWVATVGFGIATGFFGVEAALWASVAVGVAVHLVTGYGLNINFSNVEERSRFEMAWNANRLNLSWLWFIGFGLTAPAWIAIAATYSRVKGKLAEELIQRRAAAADKKRIEARRQRLRLQRERSGDDPLEKARKGLEEAQARARKVGANAPVAPIDSVAGSAAIAPTEMTGESKLKNDHMITMLGNYARSVREMRRTIASGLEVDAAVQTGFDRVIMNMPDDWLDYLRKDSSEQSMMLLDYYDELCRVEDAAARGGDGEIVIASNRVWDEDQIDAMGSGYGTALGGGDLLDEDDDEEFGSSGRAAEIDSSMEMVLSGASAEVGPTIDGTPKAAGLLPLAEDEDEDEDDADGVVEGAIVEGAVVADDTVPSEIEDEVTSREVISEPELVGEYEQGENTVDSFGASEHDDVEIVTPGQLPEESMEESAEGLQVASEVVEQLDTDTAMEVVVDPAIVMIEAETLVDSAAGDAAVDEAMDGGDTLLAPVATAVVVAGHPQADALELRRAAGVILSGGTKRDFVMSTMGWFSSAADAAAALGLDETMFVDPFAVYDQKVHAAQLEIALAAQVAEGGSSVEEVERSIAALESTAWEFDPEVVARARAWVVDENEKERLRLEEEQRVENERVEQARLAREAQELKEREDQERLEREAQELKEREEADRLERERLELEERQAREELERKTALEAKRNKYAVRILAGKLDDDILQNGFELFPNVEALATTLELDVEVVADRYDEFASSAHARMKYDELAEAFRMKDVNAVEALLAQPEAYEGYAHPTIVVEDIRRWAEGERARERLIGLREGEMMGGQSDQNRTRRLFMMRRLDLSAEIAKLVDEDLPKAMRTSASLDATVEMLGDSVPAGVVEAAGKVHDQIKLYAARIIAIPEGKGSAREYVQAFLPDDVRRGEDVWETLLALGAGIDLSEPVVEQVEAAVVDREPEPEPSAQQGGRGRIEGIKVGFEPKRTRSIEDLAKIKPSEVIARSVIKELDVQRELRNLRMSLRDNYGEAIDQLVHFEGDEMYASVRDASENVIGRIKIVVQKTDAVVWYSQESGYVVKNVATNVDRTMKRDSFARSERAEVSDPNGHAETIVGAVLVSPILTEEGALSLTLAPEVHPRIRSMSLQEAGSGKELLRFVMEVEKQLG